MNTIVPNLLDPHIREFCFEIMPSAKPRFVAIVPEDGCEPLNCFNNVQRKVEIAGGRIQFGWAIWEWPRVYVEAEHHAVYAPADEREWIDLTPDQDGETHRLFIPDDSAVYDFENEGIRRDNLRKALSDDPLVRNFFSNAKAITAILNTIHGIGEVHVDFATAQRIHNLEDEKRKLIFDIGMKYTARNQRCFCGSGEKFKRCHGRAR